MGQPHVRLTRKQMEAAELAILSAHGCELLTYMRAVFLGCGYEASSTEIPKLAASLGWIVPGTEAPPRLTGVGWKIADSAREYCNWLDDNRSLPLGLSPEHVKNRRVLDVGCGFGRYLFALKQHGAWPVGVDPDQLYIQISEALARKEQLERAPIVRATAESLPFRDKCFDVVLCIRSIYYMRIDRALEEISRVLVDGGRFFVVMKPLSHLVSQLLAGNAWRGGPRAVARSFHELANSCSFSWFGRRLTTATADRANGAPVHMTCAAFDRCLRRADLTLTEVDPKASLFVAVKKARDDRQH